MPLIQRPKQHHTSDQLYTPSAPPPSALGPVPVWLRIVWGLELLVFAAAYLPGSIGLLCTFARWILLVIAIAVSMPYLYRAAKHGLLWRLRNKLILTYLLIGLTPVVLFFTLVFLSAYVAAGQFAIHLAAQHLQLRLDSIGTSDAGFAFTLAHRVESGVPIDELLRRPDEPAPPQGQRRPPPERPQPDNNAGGAAPVAPRPGGAGGRQLAIYVDNTPLEIPGISGDARSPLHLAEWMTHRRAGQMKVVVADSGTLYVTVVDRVAAGHGHTVTVIGTTPVTARMLNEVADGLGQVTLVPGLLVRENSSSAKAPTAAELRRTRLVGGSTPAASNFFDGDVRFTSTLSAIDWETGEVQPVTMYVESRPSILFEQLFGAGLTGRITDTVRISFLLVCLFFALLEVFAFYVAMRLTQSMTSSVEDLYNATLAIDSGNLNYRIRVRHDDQLADLGRSFNRMSWSLGRLIDEQKEKERMQSELSIAQEVQANLFPLSHVHVPTLELHGICRPARTVSGDYYDFLLFHDDPDQVKKVTGVGLALGDISGKGISAALLMATLHSAVRAFRFASEELFGESRGEGHQHSLECGELFESPARILALLNRHLYRTTQMEKYATLFLAHYDDRSCRLTYSNGGQLPPFVMKTDGTVRKLEKGGTVVGLIDGMHYEQETLSLEPGDLLIAYSDGVTEPENDFGDFGEDRLLEVVRQFRDEPLERISAEVMAALDAWIGGIEQPDDITLVLARRV